jgi:hypothetical protein
MYKYLGGLMAPITNQLVRVGRLTPKFQGIKVEIIVHNSKSLSSPNDVYNLFTVPLWEVEIVSPVLIDPDFNKALEVDADYGINDGHRNHLRSKYTGESIVSSFSNVSQKDRLLEIALQHPLAKPRFFHPISYYQEHARWFSTILKDEPGFRMWPHIDNSHIMIQMIVNLLQDNDTSTVFFNIFDQQQPVYQAPRKQNHGIVFLNTPGSIHTITGVTKKRHIWYAGVLI